VGASLVPRLGASKDGFPLELGLFCGIIIASHCNGFGGCKMREFLRYLSRELDIGGVYGSGRHVPSMNYGSFPPTILDIDVPYCSPTVAKNWPMRLVKDIEALFLEGKQSKFGIVFPSGPNSRFDCFMVSVTSSVDKEPTFDRIVLVGEAKQHRNPLGSPILKEILIKFNSLKDENTHVFIVSCLNVSEMKNFVDSDYCIWVATWRHGNIFVEEINAFQSTTASRHVIILALANLYSGQEPFDSRISRFCAEK
jgi:hypothetical protein